MTKAVRHQSFIRFLGTIQKQQECIPVGCVLTACQPYVWWLPQGVSSWGCDHRVFGPVGYGPRGYDSRGSMAPRDMILEYGYGSGSMVPSPVDRQDTCENITFLKLRLHVVKTCSDLLVMYKYFVIRCTRVKGSPHLAVLEENNCSLKGS